MSARMVLRDRRTPQTALTIERFNDVMVTKS
jgi:hypothetical protein